MPGIRPDSLSHTDAGRVKSEEASSDDNQAAAPEEQVKTTKHLPEPKASSRDRGESLPNRQVKPVADKALDLNHLKHDFSNQVIRLDQAYSGLMLIHQGITQANGLFFQPVGSPAVMVSAAGKNLPKAVLPQYYQLVSGFQQNQGQMMAGLCHWLYQCQQQLQMSMGRLASWAVDNRLHPLKFIQLLPNPVLQPQPIALASFPGLFTQPALPDMQVSPWLPKGWGFRPDQPLIKGFPSADSHWSEGQLRVSESPNISGFYFQPQPPASGMVFQHPLSPHRFWSNWVNKGRYLPEKAFYDHMRQLSSAYSGLAFQGEQQTLPDYFRPISDPGSLAASTKQAQLQSDVQLVSSQHSSQDSDQEELKQLKHEVNQLREREKASKNRLNKLDDSVESPGNESVLDSSHDELNSLKQRLVIAEAKDHNAEQAVKKLQAELETLEKDYKVLAKDKNNLSKKLAQQKKEVGLEEPDLEAMRLKIATLKKDKEQANKANQAAKKQLKNLDNDLKKTEDELSLSEGKVDRLSKEKNTLNLQNKELVAERDALKERLAIAEPMEKEPDSAMEALKADMEQLRNQAIHDAENKKAILQELEQKKRELDDALSHKQVVADKTVHFQTEAEKLSKQLQQLTKEYENLASIERNFNREKNQMITQLSELQENLDQYRNRIKVLTEEKDFIEKGFIEKQALIDAQNNARNSENSDLKRLLATAEVRHKEVIKGSEAQKRQIELLQEERNKLEMDVAALKRSLVEEKKKAEVYQQKPRPDVTEKPFNFTKNIRSSRSNKSDVDDTRKQKKPDIEAGQLHQSKTIEQSNFVRCL